MIYFLSLIFNCFVISATTPVIEIPNKECFERYFRCYEKPIAMYIYTLGNKGKKLVVNMSFYNAFERYAYDYRNSIRFLSINRDRKLKRKESLYKILNLDRLGIDPDETNSHIALFTYSQRYKKHVLSYVLYAEDRLDLSTHLRELIKHERAID